MTTKHYHQRRHFPTTARETFATEGTKEEEEEEEEEEETLPVFRSPSPLRYHAAAFTSERFVVKSKQQQPKIGIFEKGKTIVVDRSRCEARRHRRLSSKLEMRGVKRARGRTDDAW